MGAVDVDHIKGDGHARDSPRLRNELFRDEMRRHLVKDASHLQRQRRLAAQLSGGTERHRRHGAAGRLPGGGNGIARLKLSESQFESLACGKVAV
jgi:hypothetical protein